MKLLANENFPNDSIKHLQNKGFDIKAVGVNYFGISDKEVIDLAEKEERTILTFDRDYGELIYKFGNKPKNGVIYLRLENYESDAPGKIIENILNSENFETVRKLTVYNGTTIRQKSY